MQPSVPPAFIGWSDNTSGSSAKVVFKNRHVTLSASTSGIHGASGASGSGRLTVPVAGKYQIYTTVRMENSPISGNIYLWVSGIRVARLITLKYGLVIIMLNGFLSTCLKP